MSLEGAKLVCLDEAGNHGQIVLAKGRKFTMGYYVSCDFVLVDQRAKGVHCEIECDAFGRVTIRNLSPDNPILVNGCTVEIKRILLNNTKLSILDKEYLWLFPKSSSNEFEDIPTEATSTPQKTVGIPEQPPNSCPDFKLHRDLPKRFTVHNFAYCIQSDEECNISSQSNNEYAETNQTRNENESEEKVETQENDTQESSKNTSQVKDLDKLKEERKRSVTPEPNQEITELKTELLETPKLDLINFTTDKENKSTQKKSKQLLTKCHHSDLVITSFSPRETGVKIEKSFVTIIKPKVQVTKTALTPKSVYSTPKTDMANENDDDDDDQDYENEGELTFHTPSTSKKPTTAPTKILTNSSMHIIDLTTPYKKRAVSPYLKSALKASAKKNITTALEKPRTKLAFDEPSHLLALPATPIVIDGTTTNILETTSSVISVNSSTDNSSVIEEVVSDRSNMGVTPKSSTGLNTPLKTKNLAVASCTPKRTPQSLMKRAILTSAKKQINSQNPATARREPINRIPLRNKLPVTPQASIGNLSLSQLPRRQSMSTPTRKSVTSANRFFDNSPSTSKLMSASSTLMSSSKTGSSLNLLTAAKALSTSTPMSESTHNAALRNRRAACKTSPLHKVRKSFGNVSLSSHISKASASASASKLTSVKNKPPQQIMSDRLVTKARKSWCFTPISSRSRDMVANAKTPTQKTCPSSSILKDRTAAHLVKKPDRTPAVLFTDNNPLDTSDEDVLSRTFTIDSDTEENTDCKKQNKNLMDTTFSPDEILSEAEEPLKKLEKEQPTIDTPLDVEEVIDSAKENEQSQCENKTEKNQTTNKVKEEEEERQCYVTETSDNKVDNKENNTTLPDSDRIKSIVTEESFAEIINDFREQNNLPPIIEISDSQRESSQNESQESFAENVEEKIVIERNKKDIAEDLVKISNQDIDKSADAAEQGFGEESTQDRDKKEEENINETKMREENQEASHVQCIEKDITVDDLNTQTNETKSLDAEEVKVVELLKCDEQKSGEYKPIVEDITLEDSVIEKETKENDIMNVSKQPLYEDITLENSQIEEKVKSEEIKEEVKEKVTKEKSEQLSSTKPNVCDKLPSTEEEISSNDIQKDLKLDDLSENIKKPQINQNELESLETNQNDNKTVNTEIVEISQQLEICKDALDNVAEQTTQRTEVLEASKSEDQSLTIDSNRVDDDIEDTNKLLEEIEDVLNKSDEIKQKQNLNETENESEKHVSSTSEIVKNAPSIGCENNLKQFKDQHDANDADLQQSSTCPQGSTQIIKYISESEVTSQGEDAEKSAEIVIMTEATEENSKKEDHSTFSISQVDEFTRNEEKSEAKEPANIIKHERSEDEIQETNISQLKINEEIIDSSEQKSTEINQSVKQTSEEETTILVRHEEAEQNEQVKDNIHSENIPKPSEKIEEILTEERSKEPAQDVDVLQYQNSNKSYENTTNTESNKNETKKDIVKELDLNKTENLQKLENNEELNTIKAKKENAISFTPRRSTRRASQSTDTPQASVELSFTPRRSTRRASLSAESATATTTTLTPTRKTTRRASLSSVNETTPLTPKPIIKRRRSSVSVDSEIPQTSTSKTYRAKTPRKQFEQRSVIPEEIAEVVDEVINENEEQLTAPETTKPSEIQTHQQSMNIQEENKISNTVLAEETTTEETTIDSSNEPKEIIEHPAIADVINTEEQQDNVEEILEKQIEIEKTEENQKCLTSNVVETTENQLTEEDNLKSEQQQEISDNNETREDTVTSQEDQNTDKVNIKTTDNSNSIEEDVKSNIAQDVTNDNLEDSSLKGFNNGANTMLPEDDSLHHTESDEKLNTTADIASESPKDTEIPAELLKTSSCSAASNEGKMRTIEAENMETEEKSVEEMPTTSTSTEQKDISPSEIIDGSPKTLLTSGEGDLEQTPEESQESGETQDLETNSSPKHKTQIKTKCESPKTPMMTGVRELLKTRKVDAETPRLGGIRDLVRTPKQNLENEDEEIEKLAVVADLTSTPKTKKHVTIVADSPKTPVMAGMRELLKTPKAEPQTPRLGGIRDLVRTPKQDLDNEDEEIEKFAVVGELIKTPVTNVAEISTPKTKKHVTIVADSPKTPVMAGMRELLKTPKAEPQTPRLGGIRDLVRTPKQDLESEAEEIEKLAVVGEIIKTPVTNVAEISTPKTKKHVTIVADSPKTPVMAGMRELLKTPKAEPQTPRLGGIRDLVRTPKQDLENEDEEIEKLAVVGELIKTPVTNVAEISTPKTKKHVTIAADSPKTPLMTGVRELLKTPKKEMITPKLSGIRNLVQTPKLKREDEQEEIEKLAVVAELIKTPDVHLAEDMPTSSMQSGRFKGVKELLKTPKSCNTPILRGIRELMQTPKTTSTPITMGVKELLETPVPHDLQTSTAEISENLKCLPNLTIPEAISTLTQAPKMSSTPLLSGVKSFMDTPAEQNDQELEQFLKTPTAKNIMIPSMPSSAVMEKSGDSIEISTEYDLNATNEAQTPNLEELFKTPMSSRYVERITASYYGQDELEQDNEIRETLQETLNKSAEEAFDKLIGQESQIHTPIRKRYTRQSFTLKTPHSQSPFTASDVLSDLPKTDVEEWIETLEEAEPPTILECDNDEQNVEELTQQDIINESEKDIQEISLSEENNKNQSLNVSVIPETCTKVYITENSQANKSTASLTYTVTKDPLTHTATKLNEDTTGPLVTSIDAEISGIDLLDQTLESVQEDPSMFEEHLEVSDNESEAENENELEISQDEGLSEPLLLSDSEDLNVSQETQTNNKILRTKNQCEIKYEDDQDLDINVQEKSILEKLPNKIDPSLAEDPLQTEEEETSIIEIKEENKTLVELDANLADNNWTGEETVDENEESIYNIDMGQTCDIITHEQQPSFIETELPSTEIKEEQKLVLDEYLPKQLFATDENIENVKQETTEVLEIFSTSQITDDVLQTSHTDETEKESNNKMEINLIHENLNAKEISIEQTRIKSTESENIFVDSTVTDICEETSIQNQQYVEGKESVESKKDKEKSSSYECQNIFMENSNIDESFADEAAANEENEDTVSEENVIDKDFQNISLPTAENENDTNDVEKEIIVSQTEQIEKEEEEGKEKDSVNGEVTEIVEKSKITESSVTFEEAERDHAIVLEEESTEGDQVMQSKLSDVHEGEIAKETQELKHTNTTEQYEMAELPSQVQVPPKETSIIEIVSLDEKQIETNSNEFSLNKLENTEITTSETLDKKEVATKSSEPTAVTQANALLTKYSIKNEESIKPSTSRDCITQNIAETAKVLADTSQFVIEKPVNEENVTSSVCELQENAITATAETIEKVSNENSKGSSTELLHSNEALTDKFTSKLIEHSEETSIKPNDDKTAKEVEIEKEKSLQTGLTETSEINIIKNLEKSPKAVERITKASEDTSDTLEETPQPLHETDDVVKETINDFEENCKHMISTTKEAPPTLTKISLAQQLPESSTEEVKPLEKSSEVLIETSEVIKYDFKIKINDLNDPTEFESNAEQILKDILSKESNTEMPECTKHLKSPVAKQTQCPQDEKDSSETGQATEMNETTINAAKGGGRKTRTVSQSSQDSTHADEKSTSSRRDRRKITQKISEQRLVEEVEEIQKETTPVIDEKDKKQKRKRTTSDSSQGSVKDDENYGPTRRGGRKVKKAPIVATVVEQKEEAEEFVPFVREEEKPNKHNPSTEEKPEGKKGTQKVNETESNEELVSSKEAAEEQSVSKETLVEPLDEIEKTPDEDINMKQIKETSKSVAEIQKQICPEEKQPTVSEELHPDDQRSEAEPVSEIDCEEHLTAVQDQVLLKEEKLSSVSFKENKGERKGNEDVPKHSNEKQEQLVSVSADEDSTIPRESFTKAHIIADEVQEEIQNQDQATESIITKTTTTQGKVQKTLVEEVVVEERLDNEEMPASSKTTNEIHLETEEVYPGNDKEQPIDLAVNDIAQVKSVTLEVQKERPHPVRSRLKVIETKQAAVHEDDTTRTRRGRRGKVAQKTPTEDVVNEEKTCEPIFSNKTEEEAKELLSENIKNTTKSAADTIEGTKVVSKESEQGSVQDSALESIETPKNPEFYETAMMIEDQAADLSKDHKQSKEMANKRGQNKQILQETVAEEPTTTRKTRRKVQVSTAEVRLEDEAKTSHVENVTTNKKDHIVHKVVSPSKEERLEMVEEPPPPPETKTNTKLTGRRGRHNKVEVKESPDEIAANEEDTTPSTSNAKKLESVQIDLPLKEIETATNEDQNDKLQETKEVVTTQEQAGNDKEILEEEPEPSTKKSIKRGRPRKKGVEEDVKLQEEITTQHTRRGGRHITSDLETATTAAAIPKGRSSNRKNKTPTEHSSTSQQQELLEVIEKPQEEEEKEIYDKLPTHVKTTTVEVSKVRSRSRTNTTPAEKETTSEQPEQRNDEEKQAIDSLGKVANIENLNNSTEEDLPGSKGKELSPVKTRVKRTRVGFQNKQGIDINEKTAKKRARHQINETEESHEEDSNIKSPQIQNTENIQSHEEEVKIEKDMEEKQQKTTARRRAAAAHEEPGTHHKELSIKSKGRRAVHEESETQRIQAENKESEEVNSESMKLKKMTTEDVSLSEVQITEVNLEPEVSLNRNATAEENPIGDKIRRGRRKAILEEQLKEDHEILLATKRRGAAVKNLKHNDDESSSSTKKRVGRKKQVEEEKEKEDKAEIDLDDDFETNKKIKDDDAQHNVIDKEEEDEKEHSENEIEESKHTENNKAIRNRHNAGKNKPENETEDLEDQHEETKKGRGRRQKTDQQDKVEQVTALQSPEPKRRGRKRKESYKETHDDTTKEQDQGNRNLTNEPERTKTNTSSNTEEEMSQHPAPIAARRGRKAIEHITAETQELEDTPGKRARNVPQRRAATAYHNYDETSDSEVLMKTKKKTESPRKSLEKVVNTPPTVIITSAAITTLSSSPVSSSTPATTARGRTRKPTAKVQQFLEKQRAKAETPKKRGLLAAVAGNDTATPTLGTPARRGRKPSTIETQIEGTPQASKTRGRPKLAANSQTTEDHSNVPETVTVIEEKEIEVQATPQAVNMAKGRRGGRKAKVTEEELNSSDEPPAKKSPLELENEKQNTTTQLVEIATPTRTAGRRNAAAAAKARIEEDALAAAAIEPPKRSRAKKASVKVSSFLAATTDTEAHSSEVDEDQTAKEEKDKNVSQLREHRLASASTIEGVEDLEDDIKIENKLKPVGKRGRKVAAVVSESPAVPVKRGRKDKIVEEVTASEIHSEPKTSRGRGRGRKNVHFDEHNEAEAASSNQKTSNDNESSPVASTSEPAKKVTRTRRK